MPVDRRVPRASKPLSPLDPPEVIEGVFRGMGRYAEEMKASRAAMGLPPAEELTPEECAALRRAFLRHAARSIRTRHTT